MWRCKRCVFINLCYSSAKQKYCVIAPMIESVICMYTTKNTYCPTFHRKFECLSCTSSFKGFPIQLLCRTEYFQFARRIFFFFILSFVHCVDLCCCCTLKIQNSLGCRRAYRHLNIMIFCAQTHSFKNQNLLILPVFIQQTEHFLFEYVVPFSTNFCLFESFSEHYYDNAQISSFFLFSSTVSSVITLWNPNRTFTFRLELKELTIRS